MSARISALFTVRVIPAVDVPEFDNAASNVVVPHPVVVGVANDDKKNVGRIMEISSPTVKSALSLNPTDVDDSVDIPDSFRFPGSARTILVNVKAGSCSCVTD